MKTLISIVLAALVLGFGSPAAADGGVSADGQKRVMTRDFTGRPPFNRRFETVDTVDLARLETNAPEVSRVKGTIFRGRPPFRRNVEKLETVDLARFEVVDESSAARLDRRPPHHKR